MDSVLSEHPKEKLSEIRLSFLLTLTEPVVCRMSYMYAKTLTVLDMAGVSLAVTDNALQMVFRHMTLLRYLNVDSCCKVTFFLF